MKFTLPFATLLAALGSAQAYGLNSPIEGQILSNSQPFTFDYSSSYFFKETTYSVTVVLAQADAWANKNNFNWGVDLGELFPKGSSGQYNAQLKPYIPSYWSKTGSYVLAVIEKHSSDSKSYNGLSVQTINVTLAN